MSKRISMNNAIFLLAALFSLPVVSNVKASSKLILPKSKLLSNDKILGIQTRVTGIEQLTDISLADSSDETTDSENRLDIKRSEEDPKKHYLMGSFKNGVHESFGKAMYSLLKRSKDEANEYLENRVIQSFAETAFWKNSHRCNLLYEQIEREFFDIDQQGFSGKTVLMILSCVCNIPDWDIIFNSEGYSYQENTAALCKRIVEKGASLAIHDIEGRTALHMAVKSINPSLCSFYIKMIPLEQINNSPWLLLVPEDIGKFRMLLQSDGQADSFDRRRSSSIESYLTEQIVRLFWEKGCDLSSHGADGNTLLHLAALSNDTRICSFLLSKGISRNHRNDFEQTALHMACLRDEEGRIVGELLSKGMLSNKEDLYGNLPLHYAFACLLRDEGSLQKLGEQNTGLNKSGWHSLHIACYFGRYAAVRFLLQQKVDCNKRIEVSGKTALMIACEMGYIHICQLLLTQPSLDKTASDKIVGTALDWATEFGRHDIVKELLRNGFDIQIPAAMARVLERVGANHHVMREILLEKWEEKLNMQDELGNTVLDYAYLENHVNVIKFLARRGVKDNHIRNNVGKPPV